MSELTREQREVLQAQEQEKELKRFNEIKGKILIAVDSIKKLAIEQDWDLNTFTVVMNLMSDAAKRKVYNTKFSAVLDELVESDPLVQGHAIQESDRVKKEEVQDGSPVV